MEGDEAPIIVGRITGVYGVRGWVRLASFTDPVDNLLRYGPWLISEGEAWAPLAVAEVRRHGKGFVARIDGCDDRDQARRYTGRNIGVPAGVLPQPEEDEYYWHELVGLEVETLDGVGLGKVDRLFETGANDVMAVRGRDRERLLPFIADVVIEVDRAAGVIRVDWDPEL